MASKRSENRRHHGEPQGRLVAEALNSEVDRARWLSGTAATRVAKIAGLIQAAVDVHGKLHPDAFRELRRLLESYKWRAVVGFVPRDLSPDVMTRKEIEGVLMLWSEEEASFEFQPGERGRIAVVHVPGTDPISRREGFIISELFGLADEGLQHRLRRCDWCKRWFFAHREDQRFHDPKCRRTYREESEEYRAQHRKLMRDRYQTKTGKKPRSYKRKENHA